MTGDLYQLPPVCGKAIYEDFPDVTIVTNTLHLFKNFFCPIFLTISQRQREDEAFAQLLRARVGEMLPEDCALLNSRSLNLDNPKRAEILLLLKEFFGNAISLLES